MKTLLHQVLAVENDKKQQASRILQETISTFTKKADHFDGIKKLYSSKNTSGDQIPPEIKKVVTTVSEKLNYAKQSIIDAIDVQLTKEETNASGIVNANLKIDNVDFGDFSSTSLLALESYLVKIRDAYKTIPTLDPVKEWKKSEDGNYQTEKEIRYRTNKEETFEVIVPATKEHPAQIGKLVKDIQVGTYETTYQSGRITPRQKSDLLNKIDKIITGVKKTRAIANQAEIKSVKIGEKIFEYIHDGIL
jgi:hypothetical protein